jgi:hypothetical protein
VTDHVAVEHDDDDDDDVIGCVHSMQLEPFGGTRVRSSAAE